MLVCLDVACFNDFAHVEQLMLTAARFCFGHFDISRGAEGHNFGVHVALRIRRKIPVLVIKSFPVEFLAAKFLVDLRAYGECKHQSHEPGFPPLFGSSSPATVVGSNMPNSLSANSSSSDDGFVVLSESRQLWANTWESPTYTADAVGEFL